MPERTLGPYLIQGYFFQEREWIKVTHVPVDGAVALVYRGTCQTMFAGIIYPNERKELVGEMSDHYGISSLTEVQLTDDVLSFKKRYDRRDRPDDIAYTFRREGAVWSGEYNGKVVGTGKARCLIREAPLLLFVP